MRLLPALFLMLSCHLISSAMALAYAGRCAGVYSPVPNLNLDLGAGFLVRQGSAQDQESILEFLRSQRSPLGVVTDTNRVDKDITQMNKIYDGKNGIFILITDPKTGKILATAAVAPLQNHAAEFRKFYIASEYQSLGWGRKILTALINWSRLHSVQRLELRTYKIMTKANQLYLSLGFHEFTPTTWYSEADTAFALELH